MIMLLCFVLDILTMRAIHRSQTSGELPTIKAQWNSVGGGSDFRLLFWL